MSFEIRRRSLLATGAAAGVAAALPGSANAARSHHENIDFGMVIGAARIVPRAGRSVVELPLLSDGRRTTVNSAPVSAEVAEQIAAGVAPGALVDFEVDRKGAAVVPEQAGNTFHVSLTKSDNAVFSTMKYGAEQAPRDGRAGAMVAAGWLYAKSRSSITVGDGRRVDADVTGRPLSAPVKRYEERYRLAHDVVVHRVDTSDWSASTRSSLAELPVTADYDYATTTRQQVFVVFDQNHTRAKNAKVVAIYYFTPADVSDGKPVWDAPTMSGLLVGRGTDPVSGTAYAEINATGVMDAPYTRSTEPFMIVPKTMYYVGDNEVSLYLFRTKDRLVLMDTGWPHSGYQYWKNIEAVGFDPRQITDIMTAHGHLDHYGTTVELVTMIENAGGTVRLHAPGEDLIGLAADAQGNTWNLPPALPESEVLIRERSEHYVYDEWMDFGNVRLMPLYTPGHTTGSASFVFEVLNPETNETIRFGYMGGYGWGPKLVSETNGWQRLGFAYNLAWLQQTVEVDFAAPQHANQYPLVDIYQALKAHNNDPANRRRQATMLDAMVPGEFVNQLEKRYAVATNAVSDRQPGYQSIETFGPFKPGREQGLNDVTVTLVDGGKVIRGYNQAMNVNPKISTLTEGVAIRLDNHVHDPEGWYAQFELKVDDAYRGYLPGSGPVESIRAEVTEVLRTQRLGSRAEAERVLASVQAGGSYRVDLTKASAIVVPADGSEIFAAN